MHQDNQTCVIHAVWHTLDFSDFSGELSADATGDATGEGWNDGAE